MAIPSRAFFGSYSSRNSKFDVEPFLLDRTLKHIFSCSQDLHKTYRLQQNEKHKKVRKLTKLLSFQDHNPDFQDHNPDFQHHKVWPRPLQNGPAVSVYAFLVLKYFLWSCDPPVCVEASEPGLASQSTPYSSKSCLRGGVIATFLYGGSVSIFRV